MADDAIIASVRAALMRAPMDVALRVHLAQLLLESGQPEEAVREAALALSHDPTSQPGGEVLNRARDALSWQQQSWPQEQSWPQQQSWQPEPDWQQEQNWAQEQNWPAPDTRGTQDWPQLPTNDQAWGPPAGRRRPGRRAVLALVGLLIVVAVAVTLTVVLVGRTSDDPHAVPAAEQVVLDWTKANNAKDVAGVKALTCPTDRPSVRALVGHSTDTDDIFKSEQLGNGEAVVYEKLTIRKAEKATDFDGVHPLYLNAMQRTKGSWTVCFTSPLAELASNVSVAEECANHAGRSDATYPRSVGTTLELTGCSHRLVTLDGVEVRYDVAGSGYQLCVTQDGASYNFDRSSTSVSVTTDPTCHSHALGS